MHKPSSSSNSSAMSLDRFTNDSLHLLLLLLWRHKWRCIAVQSDGRSQTLYAHSLLVYCCPVIDEQRGHDVNLNLKQQIHFKRLQCCQRQRRPTTTVRIHPSKSNGTFKGRQLHFTVITLHCSSRCAACLMCLTLRLMCGSVVGPTTDPREELE